METKTENKTEAKQEGKTEEAKTTSTSEFGAYGMDEKSTTSKKYIYWERGQTGYKTLALAKTSFDITAFVEAVLSGGKNNGALDKSFIGKVIGILPKA